MDGITTILVHLSKMMPIEVLKQRLDKEYDKLKELQLINASEQDLEEATRALSIAGLMIHIKYLPDNADTILKGADEISQANKMFNNINKS